MNIEVTIANEAAILELVRQALLRQARMLVMESPERVGKRSAMVHLSIGNINFSHDNIPLLNIELGL